MVEFLLFCIATVGMTSIIVQGVIFQPFRQYTGDWAEKIHHRREQAGKISRRSLVEWFNELINCAQCTGFWCGLFCGLFLLTSGGYGLEGFGIYLPGTLLQIDTKTSITYNYLAFDYVKMVNRLLLGFCCGLGGSFLAAVGCNFIDWGFYRKMNALRQLEEQDIMLAHRRAELEVHETT